MAVRYLRSTIAMGESSSPININEKNQMMTFDVKVIDLPGPTRNGVLYPLEEMKKAISRDRLQQQLATGAQYGEHDHPANPQDLQRWGTINMENTSFKWQKFWFKGNELWGTIQTVPINGDLLRKCILAGEFPSFSIRVLGEQSPSDSQAYIQLTNIHLVTVDWVRYPGNPDSFLKNTESFNVMDSPIENPDHVYKGFVASGESVLINNGLMKEGEKIISMDDKGLFAVAESITDEKYNKLKAFRLSAF